MEWLLGGAVGAVLACLGMGLLLWRERDRRAGAEALAEERAVYEGRALTLARIVVRKEERIRDLERALATVDPGALLDRVFKRPAPSDPD